MVFVKYVGLNVNNMEQICNKCKGPLEKPRTHYSKKVKCRACQHKRDLQRYKLRNEAKKSLSFKS